MRKCMLTTFDNPFDPFEQFTSWFLFDVEKGYGTCDYLARIAKTSEQLSSEEDEREIERAIDEIVAYDFRNIYKKVVKDVADDFEFVLYDSENNKEIVLSSKDLPMKVH